MTRWDKYLIIIMIMMAFGGMYIVKSITTSDGQMYLVVEVEGKDFKKISLSPSVPQQRIEINSSYGHNVVEFDGTGAKMIEADCRDQLCTKMGKITKANQTNVCLPNRVTVKLINDKSDVDIISY